MTEPCVLIVEDHADTAAALGINLTRNGFQFEHCSDLASAIKRANREPFPRVTLLDLRLPDSSAENTVGSIPDLMRNGPVVVLSAYEDEHLRELIERQGAFFCHKIMDELGTKRIFEAMVSAIQSWRNVDISNKKKTGPINIDFLELSALNPLANGHH